MARNPKNTSFPYFTHFTHFTQSCPINCPVKFTLLFLALEWLLMR